MTHDPHADRTVENGPEDAEYLGVLTNGAPLYYHEPTRAIYEGHETESGDGVRFEERQDFDLAPEDPLARVLAEIGDGLGWESLSEFAHEHISEESN